MGLIRILITYPALFFLILVAGVPGLHAQQTDTLDTSLNEVPQDTTTADSARYDTAYAQPEPSLPEIDILPWRYSHSITGREVSNDSLMRWKLIPDWTVKRNRDPGVLTFRLGTVGRSNALMIGAHEPRHQELVWEDIPVHNRVSGTVNWSVLPIHKINTIYEETGGITHQTNFFLKKYYVVKPMSKLIFDESKFNRRALEFWVTQNFSHKTNVELSYWDRRGGGGYPNSSFNGSQIFGRAYHQPDNRQFFKLRFLNGQRTLGVPFGYLIPDLRLYNFNRFSTQPAEPSGQSVSKHSTLALSYHRRPDDTTAVSETLRAGIFLNNQEREVSYSADTTFYKVGTIGAFAHKWVDLEPLKLEGVLRYELFSNNERQRSSLNTGDWGLLSAIGKAKFEPLSWSSIEGQANYKNRGDGYSSYSFGADLNLAVGNRLSLSGGGSIGTLMPSMQQLYWSSNQYAGSEQLNNEKILEAHSSAEYRILQGLKTGVKGQAKQVSNGVMLNTENDFINTDQYQALSLTGFAEFESTHFEISASGTVQQYRQAFANQANAMPAFNTTRIWTRGSAYWKGYIFDRAAYLKAGVAGMLSPFVYRAESYNTALDYWQPASQDQQLPWFSRMDIDVTARVRSVMFVLRFENVLDDVNQLGYFETAQYPMPPRQFLFGVRAIFSN